MCKHATGRIFCPILIKFGTNVPFANISAKFKNGPNRSNQSALLGGSKPQKWRFPGEKVHLWSDFDETWDKWSFC